ncbi:hypothetical protein HOF65_00695 [bacterium]|nr:hypothetical protein [bacterium]MBT3852563.1 hypothetical protein [bacterium]MBT4632730.1 hypothetical protein [bacterium]MBT5492571.1 hypothetical protein [bacterium]MBT6778581.1 hypothetical protein [bacterium]
MIVKAISSDIKSAIIANFGIGHIYSHIIHQTANIAQKANNLENVDNTTQTHTSHTASKTASNLVFQV